MPEDTATIQIWNGYEFDGEPDEEIKVEYGTNHIYTDDPYSVCRWGISMAEEDRPATLNAYTNDSVRSPPGYDSHVERAYWDGPIERGLTFRDDRELRPFGCEVRGRILFHVEDGI